MNGVDLFQVTCKEGYFHNERCSVKCHLINSYGLTYSSHTTTVTCILYLLVMADWQASYTYVM